MGQGDGRQRVGKERNTCDPDGCGGNFINSHLSINFFQDQEGVMFKKLFLTAVLTVAAGLVLGCGGDDNPTGNNGGNNSGGSNTSGNNNGGNTGVVDPNTVVKSTFTDNRNGQTYKTVKIGEQIWMAENLNYQTDSSWCYGEGGGVHTDDFEPVTLTSSQIQANCNTYGRLYAWNAAKKSCPNGWKLPDTADWFKLVRAVDSYNYRSGQKLRSKSGWYSNGTSVDGDWKMGGTDEYGFSAMPGGWRDYRADGNGAQYYGLSIGYGLSSGGWWWTATDYADAAFFVTIGIGGDIGNPVLPNAFSKDYGYSVRCIKN